MSDFSDKLAAKITYRLFRDGDGDVGTRLQIKKSTDGSLANEQDLGGWNKMFAEAEVASVLRDAMQVEGLLSKLAAAESRVKELHEALEMLWTYQNGSPLPSYEKNWTQAMAMAEKAMAKA